MDRVRANDLSSTAGNANDFGLMNPLNSIIKVSKHIMVLNITMEGKSV